MMRILSLVLVGCLALSGLRAADAPKPLKALLVCGGCCHDYAKQKLILKAGLEERAHIEVTLAHDPDNGTKHLNPIYASADWAKGYDVIIHDECSADVKDKATIDLILQPHKDGLPGVNLHCAMHSYRSEGFPKSTPWFDFTGLATTGHGPQVPIEITYTDKEHPITKTLENWTTGNEELYNNVAGKLLDTGSILARGKQTIKAKDGKEKIDDTIVIWTNKYNEKTRVFNTTLGHNNTTVQDPKYLDLVTRGLLWSCDKLNDTYLKKK